MPDVPGVENDAPKNPYAEAALVACPRCGAGPGVPCRERYCRNGVQGCTYAAACSAVRELPAPHPFRLSRAALTLASSPGESAPMTEKVRALDDDICGALMAAKHGSYDGRNVEQHLERLLDKFRALVPDPEPR